VADEGLIQFESEDLESTLMISSLNIDLLRLVVISAAKRVGDVYVT